jgi:hypothetical protein
MIAVLVATVLAPRAARAYSSSKSHSTHGSCDSENAAVGRSTCGVFGLWGSSPDEPALIIDLELGLRRWMVPTALGPEGSRAAFAFGPRTRVLATFHWLYVGGEFDALGVVAGPDITRDGNGDAYHGEPLGVYALRAVGGAHLRLGPITAALELAGGGQLMQYDPLCSDLQPCSSMHQTSLELEGRARADLWMTRNLTIGAAVGANALDARDFTVMIALGVHPRGWDGQ